ncbi:MAG: thioredoxin, partial [Gammaproteobacteria bacterium]|nr:thioredoxin [Gammaproteobacteria bacterium]
MNYSIIVKEDCATCQLVVPVIKQLQTDDELTIYSQDNVQFPAGVSVIDDTELEYSWRRRIETVPTLIKFDVNGAEISRVVGWDKNEWQV